MTTAKAKFGLVEDERDRLLLQVDGLKKIVTRLRHHVSTDNICDCPAHMEGQPHRDGCLLMAVAEVTGETPKTEKRKCARCGADQKLSDDAHAIICTGKPYQRGDDVSDDAMRG